MIYPYVQQGGGEDFHPAEILNEALNFIEFAGLSDAIEVRIGQCEELVEELRLGMNDGVIVYCAYLTIIISQYTLQYYYVNLCYTIGESLALHYEGKECGCKARRIWR